jgi:hypothetical protein
MQQEKLDLWALVELFGHSKIAGRITEQNIAGTNMLRVDVPETSTQPAFTRFLGSSAIYAINPTDEATAKYYADKLQTRPIDSWDVREMLKKNDQYRLALAAPEEASARTDEDIDEDRF